MITLRRWAAALALLWALALAGCGGPGPAPMAETAPEPASTAETTLAICEHVPYEAMLNLEVMDGCFRFRRIATTPSVVYATEPLDELSRGLALGERHEILSALFRAMDGKPALAQPPACDFSHYLYLFDGELPDIPWRYSFALCDCGAVSIANRGEAICDIRISPEELDAVLQSLGQ